VVIKPVLVIDALNYPLIRATRTKESYWWFYYDYQPEDQGGESGICCQLSDRSLARIYPKNSTVLLEDIKGKDNPGKGWGFEFRNP